MKSNANLAKMNVLIMAASRGPGDPMAHAFKVQHKCLIEIDGKAMLLRVVQALRTAPEVGSIGVSIDRFDVLNTLPGLENIELFKSAASAPNSVIEAIEHMDSPFPLLVTTADHALLNAKMIGYFCKHAEQSTADIVIGLAERAEIERVDSATRRTYFKFREGQYSGCNLYYLRSEQALKAVRFWHRVDQIRKRPVALARTFSFVIMVKYLFGILSLGQAFEYATKLLGVRAAAVILPYGEAAIDVDKPEDHQLVTKLLQQRR